MAGGVEVCATVAAATTVGILAANGWRRVRRDAKRAEEGRRDE